jgi:branched-chain amino acid transport system permease protein
MSLLGFLQSLVYGIFIGSLYGLASSGLSLIFGVMRFLNLSHGELVLLGAYFAYSIFSILKIDPYIAIPLTMLILFLFGLLLYLGIFGRFAKFGVEDRIRNSLLVGFGLLVALDNLIILVWTANEQTIRPAYSGQVLDLFGLRLSYIGLIGLALSILFIVGLNAFLNRTYFGKSIRATSQDFETASLMGINVWRTYFISFAIGVSMAAIAGTILGTSYAFSPGIGQSWTLKSLIVLVLAGVGNVGAVLYSGLILGVVESLGAYFLSFANLAPYREALGIVLFILVLIFRQGGLFVKKAG